MSGLSYLGRALAGIVGHLVRRRAQTSDILKVCFSHDPKVFAVVHQHARRDIHAWRADPIPSERDIWSQRLYNAFDESTARSPQIQRFLQTGRWA